MFQLTTVAAAVAATTFVSSVAFAQEYQTTEEKMVVVSSRAPKAISDIPGTVWYIDNAQIEQEYRGGKSLGEILAAAVPSLDVSSQGRTNYGQNLRGRPMLVMIDGVSLNSSRLISRQLDSIDPFNIDRIEILSGATAIYGAGATGGVINIVTKKAESDELQFESYVSTTSGFNSSDDFDYKLAQSVSGGNNLVKGRASVVYGETQGFYDANGDIVVPDITQGSVQFNEVIDVLGTLSITPTDTQTVNLLAQYYSSEQDSPYGIYFGQDLAGVNKNITGNPGDKSLIDVREGFESDRQGSTERLMLNVDYSNTDFLSHELLVQASYRNETLSFIPFIYSTYLAASEQETDVISLRAAMIKSLDNLTLTYGIDGYIDRLDSNQMLFDRQTSYNSGGLVNRKASMIGRYPGTEVSSIAGFIQADFAITEDWTVEGGYRFQYMNNKVDDFVASGTQVAIAHGNGTSADAVPGGETDYDIGLFNLGTIYHLTQNDQVWANFSQGFDLSDPAKYYGVGTYNGPDANGHYNLAGSINVDDSTLAGIKTNSYEIGYRHDGSDLSIQTAVYYSQSDKEVSANKKTLNIEISDNKTRVYGWEGQAAYWLSNAWQAGVNGHLVKTEVQNSDGGWDKQSINYASASKAGAWLAWFEDSYALKLQSQTLFNLDDEAGNEINGYTVFDLVGNYQLPVGSLGFGIQNLLDREYSTVWGQRAAGWYSSYGPAEVFDYKGRGRTYTVNYQVKF